MTKNKIPKLREPRGEIVKQIRDMFLEQEYNLARDDFYEQDIKLVENMDFLLQRFVIMQRKKIEPSVKMVSQMLKWRKERKLYDLTINSFPQELTICGAAFTYENDKYGNRTVYLRAGMCKNCAELRSASKDFLSYLMFKTDDPIEGSPFVVIMDLTNTTWSNYDIDLLMHLLALLKDYFPVNLDYVLAINFPWILSTAWSLIKHLIPSEKRDAVQFISSSKVFDYIDKENCPDFLGGTCTKPYTSKNPGAPNTIEYLVRHGEKPPTTKRLREILTIFKDILPKDHKELLKRQLELLPDNVPLTQDHLNDLKNNNATEQEQPIISKKIDTSDGNNNLDTETVDNNNYYK